MSKKGRLTDPEYGEPSRNGQRPPVGVGRRLKLGSGKLVLGAAAVVAVGVLLMFVLEIMAQQPGQAVGT